MQLGVLFGAGGLGGLLPKVGLMAAGMALNFAFSEKKQKNAQKLQDLKVSSSAYGRGIPIVWGSMRCTGNMFWATDLIEKKRIVGKKGKSKPSKKVDKGKAEEIYEYYANFAMGLCEGVMDDVIRIWADSNLIYDRYNPGEAKQPGFSQPDDGGGGKGANKKGDNADAGRWNFRFYGGTETQGQDPLMVRYMGRENTPAHRGLCYIIFEEFPLLDFGNRIPTITAEVVARRERAVMARPWERLPPEKRLFNDNTYSMRAEIDPLQNELIQIVYGATDGGNKIRIWDIVEGKEIRQLDTGNWDVIGIAGSGDLFAREGDASNHKPVALINRNNGEKLTQAGVPKGSSTSFRWSEKYKTVTVPHAIQAVPIAVPTPLGPLYYTRFITIFGDIGIWDHTAAGMLNGPVGGTNVANYGWFYRPEHICQAAPGDGAPVFLVGPKTIFYFDGRGPFINPDSYYDPIELKQWWTAPDPGVQHVEYIKPEPPIWFSSLGYYMVLYSVYYQAKYHWYVQAVSEKGKTLWELPLGNLNASTLSWKPFAHYRPVPVVAGSLWSFITNDRRLVTINMQTKQFEVTVLPNKMPTIDGPQFYLETQGAIIAWGTGEYQGQKLTTWWTIWINKFKQNQVNVADICRDVCIRCGIDPARIDTSKLKDEFLHGYIVENPDTGRSIIENLAQVFFFDVAESDDKLKFVSRGQNSIITIPENNLVRIEYNDQDVTYKESRMQEIDLPQTTVVSFINAEDDYQTGSQHYRRPNSPMSVMQSKDVLDVNVPIAMGPDRAKQMAEQITMASWVERINHEFRLPWSYLIYDPTDVMVFKMNDGLTFVDRMIELNIGGDYSIEATGIAQITPTYTWFDPPSWSNVPAYDPLTGWQIDLPTGGIIDPDTGKIINPMTGEEIPPYQHPEYPELDEIGIHSPYDPVSSGSPSGGAIYVPRPRTSVVDALMLDTAFVVDGDRDEVTGDFPIYWGAGSRKPGFMAGFLRVAQGSGEMETLDATNMEAVWGYVSGIVPPPPNGPFATDDETKIKLIPMFDYHGAYVYEWQSVPPDEWPSYQNMVLIGNELILFRDVELQEDGTVIISHLIRGHRGTDRWAYQHQEGERFVLMNNEGVRLVGLAPSSLNQKVVARISSTGILSSFAPVTEFTFKANSLRPAPPNDVRREDTGDSSKITWQRCTRFNGGMRDGTGTVPLNEEQERYRVYISDEEIPLNFDPDTDEDAYVRMEEVSTNSFTYTSTMKSEDGIDGQAPFWVAICQVSADVGPGFPRIVKLYPSNPSYKS